MNRVVRLAVSGLIPLLFMTSPANAYDWSVEANVTQVEASYAPAILPFYLNAAAGNCPSGSALQWDPVVDASYRSQNFQAILSVLMTAMATGRKVRLFGTNNCKVQYMYLI